MDQTSQVEGDTPIKIEIVDSTLRDKVVVYLIRGEDKNGQYEANRRFNDFFNLRVALVTRWPGCYVPPVPDKQTFGNTDKQFIEDRKKFLAYFLAQISTMKYLYYSDEFQTFIRVKNQDIERTLNQLPKQTVGDLNLKYKEQLSHLQGKQINAELNFKTTSFGNYLIKSLKALEGMKLQIKNLSDVKKRYNEQFIVLTQQLLPDYEKNVVIEYADKNQDAQVFNTNNDVKEFTKQIKENVVFQTNFDQISDLIRVECREIESFQEALIQKDNFEKAKQEAFIQQKEQQSELSKLLAGKTTFKSFFSKGSSQDQIVVIEKKISEVQTEIDGLTQLIDIIQVHMGYDLIDQFKYNKTQKYIETIIKVSQLEIDLNNLHISLWSEVAKLTKSDQPLADQTITSQ